MLSFVWAFTERLLPKFASAGLMLVLAAILTPEVVGLYSWMVIVHLLIMSATDVPARQVMVIHAGTPAGRNFIRYYRVLAVVAGTLVTAIALGTLYAISAPDLRNDVLALTPFLLVPFSTSIGVAAVAKLQVVGDWRAVASRQAVASVASLAVSVPVLVLTRSIAASAIQAVLVELIFSLLCVLAAHRVALPARGAGAPSARVIAREYAANAGYVTLGWGQTRADGIAIGIIAGTPVLAVYSFALSIGRSIGDAASSSIANVVRPRIAAHAVDDFDGMRRTVERTLYSSLPIILAAIVGTLVATEFVIRPLLSADWDDALNMVPLLTVVGFPTALAWSATGVLQRLGRMKVALPIPMVGIALAIPIAFAALADLRYAAMLVVARELVIGLSMVAVCGKAAPWKAAILVTSATLLCVALAAWVSFSR